MQLQSKSLHVIWSNNKFCLVKFQIHNSKLIFATHCRRYERTASDCAPSKGRWVRWLCVCRCYNFLHLACKCLLLFLYVLHLSFALSHCSGVSVFCYCAFAAAAVAVVVIYLSIVCLYFRLLLVVLLPSDMSALFLLSLLSCWRDCFCCSKQTLTFFLTSITFLLYVLLLLLLVSCAIAY